jgi:hypothetical protein
MHLLADYLPTQNNLKTRQKNSKYDFNFTPVKSSNSSIEGKEIEKKEGLFNAFNKENVRQLYQARRIVDNTKYQLNGSLVLPIEVTSLVDNPMYLPRHYKLARDYGVEWLLKLAELAKTKRKPSRWYAKVTSIKKWQQTEEMLINLLKKIDEVKQKLQGINVSNKWLMYYVHANKHLPEYLFNRCIEYAKARGVKDPPNYLAKSIKNSLLKSQDHLQSIVPKPTKGILF